MIRSPPEPVPFHAWQCLNVASLGMHDPHPTPPSQKQVPNKTAAGLVSLISELRATARCGAATAHRAVETTQISLARCSSQPRFFELQGGQSTLPDIILHSGVRRAGLHRPGWDRVMFANTCAHTRTCSHATSVASRLIMSQICRT